MKKRTKTDKQKYNDPTTDSIFMVAPLRCCKFPKILLTPQHSSYVSVTHIMHISNITTEQHQ